MTENLTIRIIPINEIDDQEWNKFLLTTSESTFFCTTDWWRAFNDAYLLQIKNEKNELLAGIPFRILSVIPFVGRYFKFCWLDSSALVNQVFEESETYHLKKLTFDALIKYLRKTQVIVLFISSKAKSHDAKLYIDLGFNIEKCASLLLDITKDENEILKLFSNRNKETIRQAQKIGVQVKIFEGESALPYVYDYCKIQQKMFEHKKKSYSNIYFKSESYLIKILSSSYNKSYLALAYYNNQPAAGAVLISYNKILSWYLGASDYLLVKTSKASNLLQYEIIKYAKNKGFINYDFGGIPFNIDPSNSDPSINLNGVYKFKKSFGGDRCEYDHCNYVLRKYRYRFIWKLRKYENHPLASEVYRVFKK
jgi:lipid II:glycine glycyltransferase (peptidoglycan interpeptide bridge formation enzyme)